MLNSIHLHNFWRNKKLETFILLFYSSFTKCIQNYHFRSNLESIVMSIKNCWHQLEYFYSFWTSIRRIMVNFIIWRIGKNILFRRVCSRIYNAMIFLQYTLLKYELLSTIYWHFKLFSNHVSWNVSKIYL